MLHLKAVQKSFREPNGTPLPILDIPAFQVQAGEQVVLMGQSGSGKTTLLHIIAGIARADAGNVIIDGIDLSRLSEEARDQLRAEKIGYIFQTFNLLLGFTALENVLLGMSFGSRPVDRPRAVKLLETVGLGRRLSHKPAMLSVGEQQRVAVARALANRPKLLLADEPTANVDAKHQQQVVELIRETCQAENVALLLVTHSSQVAEQFPRVEQLGELNKVGNEARKLGS